MSETKEEILNIINKKIKSNESTFNFIKNNPVNIKQKRALSKIRNSIKLLKELRELLGGVK